MLQTRSEGAVRRARPVTASALESSDLDATKTRSKCCVLNLRGLLNPKLIYFFSESIRDPCKNLHLGHVGIINYVVGLDDQFAFATLRIKIDPYAMSIIAVKIRCVETRNQSESSFTEDANLFRYLDRLIVVIVILSTLNNSSHIANIRVLIWMTFEPRAKDRERINCFLYHL